MGCRSEFLNHYVLLFLRTVLSLQTFTGLDKHNFQWQIENIFFTMIFSIFWGAQKNRLIETVYLSTHNICFGWNIRKLLFCYALLT